MKTLKSIMLGLALLLMGGVANAARPAASALSKTTFWIFTPTLLFTEKSPDLIRP